ncbi:hypothetical protein CEY04_04160 [Achromobacter sp. HZ28]|nr:hypothetical protein CEY05_04165 [Achromobacter sp. HZ34]OWT82624.1 hypothetical protein CEY04_04160 [Achromobacter sp. HZ28]
MDEALTTRASDSPLRLQRFADPVYVLSSAIAWTPNRDQTDFSAVVAPRGFVTDLASIPRVFWVALRPDADYAYAAIIHDFLYWQQVIPKDRADLIFKMSMEDFQLSKTTVATLYYAVARLGHSAWRENALARSRGERRILRKFPPDARTTWEQWKARNDVFAT